MLIKPVQAGGNTHRGPPGTLDKQGALWFILLMRTYPAKTENLFS
jgi:hypothetical protein